ncbi:unnamed protein product, partial [Meganyctiphanes norvegica]
GPYVVTLFLLCLIPQFPCKLTPPKLIASTNLKTSKEYMASTNITNEYVLSNSSNKDNYDVSIDIVDLRADGVKFQWDLVGAWNDVPDGFAITVGPHANGEWTPWPESCSDILYCNEGPCKKDTKNVGECESVQGCRSGQITVTASGISFRTGIC